MARVPKSSATRVGRLPEDESNLEYFGLGLKPAELEVLLERLCSCSVTRIQRGVRTHDSQRCPHRVRQWCRLGKRGAGAERVETRFG